MVKNRGSVVARLDTPGLVGSIDETLKNHTTIENPKVSFGKMSSTCKHHVIIVPKVHKYGCRITKGTCNKDDCPKLHIKENKYDRSNKYRRRRF